LTTEEKPTPGNEGASIEDRLTQYLSAQDAPADTQPGASSGASAETEVEPDEGVSESQEPQFTTADLAKYLGVEADQLDLDEDGTVKLKTKVDGKEGAAKLSQLLKDHQIQGAAENRLREAAEREKALQAREQEAQQVFSQRLQHAEHLTNLAGQELMREFQSIDWQTLRHTDPGEYAARMADFQRRDSQIKGAIQNIEQSKHQTNQQFQQQILQRTQREAQRLVDLVPEWKDVEKRDKDSAEIRKLASERGVPPEMVQAISEGPLVNAGLISIMRDAIEFQRLKASKAEVEQKVRTAPKLVKPGQAVQNSQEQNLRNLKNTVTKSGGRKGVEELLIARGLV
jgi:hypothetical protein